jgi:Malate synthase
MRGGLQATFEKNGRRITRRLHADRVWRAPQDGAEFTLPGRALLFVRNVGHLMTTPAVRLRDGSEAPEGILDAMVTALIGMRDLRGLGRLRNSRAGSIYIVKPKIHGFRPKPHSPTGRTAIPSRCCIGSAPGAKRGRTRCSGCGIRDSERRALGGAHRAPREAWPKIGGQCSDVG